MRNIITDNFNEFLGRYDITVSKTKKPLVWRIKIDNYVHYDLCIFAFSETFKQELDNKDMEIIERNFLEKIITDFTSVYIKFKSEADEALFVLKTYTSQS
jgi:hypothetical protein